MAPRFEEEYELLQDNSADETGEVVEERSAKPSGPHGAWHSTLLICKLLAIAAAVALVVDTWLSVKDVRISSMKLQEAERLGDMKGVESRCVQPVRRLSWTQMEPEDKRSYINAALCMANRSSHIHPGSTVYDDFTYIHIVHGDSIHFGAGNLPWHRLHLFLWEQALRRECGYQGYLPYWEWQTEYEDLLASSLFDDEVGFGGDGAEGVSDTSRPREGDLFSAFDKEEFLQLDERLCIQSGPFTRLHPQWFAHFNPGDQPSVLEYRPHCLTRRFATSLLHLSERPGGLTEMDLSPERIEEILAINDYSKFNLAVENLHLWASAGIGGDFVSLSAPNDPIFYLHLCNIDRIWWLWQQRHDEALEAYGGEAERGKNVTGSLDDFLPFQSYPGLDRPVTVREFLSTGSGTLGMCYMYGEGIQARVFDR